jgi:hypothetical protein
MIDNICELIVKFAHLTPPPLTASVHFPRAGRRVRRTCRLSNLLIAPRRFGLPD